MASDRTPVSWLNEPVPPDNVRSNWTRCAPPVARRSL